MATFNYTALDRNDAYVKGHIEASNEKKALKMLEKEGFLVANIKRDRKKRTFGLEKLFQDISRLDKIFFTRHLHTMLESGIALDEAIKVTAEQINNEVFRNVLTDIYGRIRKGETLHESLAHYPKYFNNFFINFIKVGEKSGKLDEVLKYLVEQQEKDYELIAKARGAMVYPSIILSAMIGVVILMMVFVIPKVTSILSEYRVELPLTTKILVGASNFTVNYGIIVLPFVVVGIFLFKKWTKSKKGRKAWASFIMSLPKINTIVQEFNIARFARSMNSLLKSGIVIDEALDLSREISNNILYQNTIKEAIVFVRRGIPMGEILKGKPKLFPPLATRMIEVGERTGKVERMLDRVANFYEKSVSRTVDNLGSVIEPFLLIAIGASVGFVAISILTPIWKFSDTVG